MKPKLKFYMFLGYENQEHAINTSFFFKSLCLFYDVEIDKENPDLIMYSWEDKNFEALNYQCKKIFLATEHFFPYELFADYKITNRSAVKSDIFFHLEMPWQWGYEDFLNGKQTNFVVEKKFPKSQFCNFIYSNKYANKRNKFIASMLKRHPDKVHCWGKYKNNIKTLKVSDETITAKSRNSDIMKHYKFSICFENSSRYNSFSEKTINALKARSIPIYWGGQQIYDFIKKEAFIDARNFKNFADLMDYIDKVDKDDKLYNSYILDNPFIDNDFIRSQCKEQMVKTVKKIIDSTTPKRKFWQVGISAKILFFILIRFYRIYFILKSLKRRFIGGV